MSDTHLATSERQRAPLLCEMCLMDSVYPPAIYCPACMEYMRDCEAEASEGR